MNPLHQETPTTKNLLLCFENQHHPPFLELCAFNQNSPVILLKLSFFFFFTFFLFSSRTQRTYLPDEGGPGILLLSLWRKKTIKPDMQRFNHFNIPPCSFFNQPTVSVIYFISEEIPCCAISLIFTWSCYVDVDFGWTFWFIFLMIFSWFLFF